MKSLKNRIFLILLALMLAATSGFASAANAAIYTQSNMSDTEAIYDFMTATGIITADEMPAGGDELVTRAEFVKLALLISNDAPKVLVSEGDVFADVKSGDTYEAYIETAKRIGYISGGSGALFNPNDYITLPQAVKILSNILGYGMLAEELGGYPTGYLAVAQRYELLNGDYSYTDGNLTMEAVMHLLYSALNAEIMELNSIGETVSIKTTPGVTLLSARHHIEKTEGIIEANAYTDLYDAAGGLGTQQIKLGTKFYNLKNSDIANMLGCRVTLFYEKTDGGTLPEAVFALASDENKIISATPRDLALDGSSLIYYEDDTIMRKLSLSNGLTLIHNKKMSVMPLQDILGLENAFITLVSNDGDNAVDVIIIDSYTAHIVNGVDKTNSIIRTNDGAVFDMKSGNKDCITIIEKDGVKVTANDINVGDSILVSRSADIGVGFLSILASKKTMTLTPNEIGDDYIIADGVKYDVSTRLLSSIAAGKSFKVYIDAFGNICHTETENDMIYGFLNAVGKQDMDDPMCRIFTENNRWVNLYFASSVKYNGTSTSRSDIYQTLLNMGDSVKQLIRYKVNADGELIQLETAVSIGIGSADEAAAIENNTFRKSYTGSLAWRNAVKSFNGNFFLASNAKVFCIPNDYKESGYSAKGTAALTTNSSYALTAYDIDDELSCPVIVVNKLTGSSFGGADSFMIVKGVGKAINAEGDAVTSVRVWRKGYEVTFTAEQSIADLDAKMAALNKGDIIIAKFDEENDIHYLNKYDTDNVYYIKDDVYAAYALLGGEVLSYDTALGRLKLCYSTEGDIAGILVDSNTEVHVYEKARDIYYMDKAINIIPGDKILVNLNYLECKELVVIRP